MASPSSSSSPEFSPFSSTADGNPTPVSGYDMETIELDLSQRTPNPAEPLPESERIFALIDKVLPFEACLYHQILPLALVDRQVRLGMVNLDDASALEYARRILSFLGYSLVPQTLSSDHHHALLSAYLNFTEKHSAQAHAATPASATIAPASQEPVEESEKPGVALGEEQSPQLQQNPFQSFNLDDREQAEEAVPPGSLSSENELSARETLVIEHPEALLEELKSTQAEDTATQTDAFPAPDRTQMPEEPAVSDRPEHITMIQPINLPQPDLSRPDGSKPIVPPDPKPKSSDLPLPGEALPILKIRPQYLDSNPEFLRQLSPDQLLQELLGRILSGGIGRLYFERRAEGGRVLWSDSGILQPPVENLSAEVFQSLLDHLKRLTRLPIAPVEQPTQVEIERMYQKNRILLRLRLIPKPYGEEATLQVLRGAALKFYQRQQLTTLSRDTLSIAKELQRKVNELHDRAQAKAGATEQTEEVPELDQVIGYMEAQLARLKALKQQSHPDQPAT